MPDDVSDFGGCGNGVDEISKFVPVFFGVEVILAGAVACAGVVAGERSERVATHEAEVGEGGIGDFGDGGEQPGELGAGFVDDDVDESEVAPAAQGFVAMAGIEPARVADFNCNKVVGELVAGGVEEGVGAFTGSEPGWELEQPGSEFAGGAEGVDGMTLHAEQLFDGPALRVFALAGDGFVDLDVHDETVGRIVSPFLEIANGLEGMEGGVDLDEGEVAGVDAELVAFGQAGRVETGLVGPGGGAGEDVHRDFRGGLIRDA